MKDTAMTDQREKRDAATAELTPMQLRIRERCGKVPKHSGATAALERGSGTAAAVVAAVFARGGGSHKRISTCREQVATWW